MPANPRGRTHGMSLTEKLAFWSEPDPDSDCVLFVGHLSEDGYGAIYWDGKPRKAHRLAWQAANGPIPEGMCVCHRCDRPACVNPDHLFLGTHHDNMRDMVRKGRRADTKGARAPNALLTDDKVREILRDKRKYREIAAAFGVSVSAVSMIKIRKVWSHVGTSSDVFVLPAARRLEKLTEQQTREIRAARGAQRQIAADYGVSQSTISAIRSGARYRHVREDRP